MNNLQTIPAAFSDGTAIKINCVSEYPANNMMAAWKWEPYQIVSLWNMFMLSVGAVAEEYAALGQDISFLKEKVQPDEDRSIIPSALRKHIATRLVQTRAVTAGLELDQATALVFELRDNLETTTYSELQHHLKSIRSSIKRQMDKRLFLYVPIQRAIHFENPSFTNNAICDAFPSASYDIKEAHNCFALGRYTASVFHSMRVIERGLRSLSKEMGVTFEQETWQKIIDQIEKKLKVMQQDEKGEEKTKRLEFLSQAVLECQFFKDAWRNHVMHADKVYDEGTASSALEHTEKFMTQLSSQLKE